MFDRMVSTQFIRVAMGDIEGYWDAQTQREREDRLQYDWDPLHRFLEAKLNSTK